MYAIRSYYGSRPTEAELAILEVLWDTGPCTVRQVHESLKRLLRRRQEWAAGVVDQVEIRNNFV